MNRSINEVEALAKKAARGAGMSWGLAEEAGRSVAGLESMGLPGAKTLSELLKHNDGVATVKLRPKGLDGTWTSNADFLCPIIVGASLSDCSHQLRSGEDITMKGVYYPILILPFVKSIARSLDLSLTLTWDNIVICTNGHSVALQGERQRLLAEQSDFLSCTSNQHHQMLRADKHRAELDEACLNNLAELAHRTYAPATEESRRLGAGAGQTDND